MNILNERPASGGTNADAMERKSFVCDAIQFCADNRAYFQHAASSFLVPPAALSEVVEAVEAYQGEPNMAYKAVAPALVRAKRAIDRSMNNAVGPNTSDVATYLTLAQEVISRSAQDGALRAFLQAEHLNLSQTASTASKRYNENSTYLAGLAHELAETLRMPGQFTSSGKKKTVQLARELVAAVANQGRTPEVFAKSLCNAIRKCKSGDDAANALQEFMAQPETHFKVAVVVDGTVRTTGLDQKLFRRLEPSKPVSWSASTTERDPSTADLDLTRFCLRHWGINNSNGPTFRHDVLAQVLITDVGAWDENQARHVALDRAEKVVDRINAEHRTSHFGVKRKVMVWQLGQKIARESFPKDKTLPTTRQMRITDGPGVDRSLRFASRAAGERAGAMQVFFAWIALEYLGRGGTKSPQNLVAEYVPYAVALVELRHLLTLVWIHLTAQKGAASLPVEVRQAVKRGPGPVGKTDNANAYDMRKLLALIISDSEHTSHVQTLSGLKQSEAKVAISAWMTVRRNLPPYAAYQIEQMREILRDNERFRKHLDAVRLDADETLQRMRFVRNQTAHNAGVGSTEHLALSDAALKILDAVFEVLPLWNRPPHQALTDISQRLKDVRTNVNARGSARHIPPFNPIDVLKP